MGVVIISESEEAKRDGAKLQPNSGRGVHHKGDAILDPFLIDYKEYANSFGVSTQVWTKLNTDAVHAGLQPALKLVLGPNNGHKTRVWVISDQMFKEMLWAYNFDAKEY